jgi:hypothetical protein
VKNTFIKKILSLPDFTGEGTNIQGRNNINYSQIFPQNCKGEIATKLMMGPSSPN